MKLIKYISLWPIGNGFTFRGFNGGHLAKRNSGHQTKFFISDQPKHDNKALVDYIENQDHYDFEFKDISCYLSPTPNGRKRVKCISTKTHAIHIFPDSNEKWFDKLRHRNQFIVKY